MSERATGLIVVGLFVALALVAGAATLVSFFGGLDWRADLLAAFRLHLGVGFGLLTVLFAVGGRMRATVLSAIGFGVNAAPTLMLFWPVSEPVDAARPPLRVLSFNVNGENDGHGEIARYVAESEADLILLLEVTPEQLQAIRDGWPDDPSAPRTRPEIVAEPRTDRFGIALIARRHLESAAIVRLGQLDLPAVEARFDWAGQSVSLLGLHPPPPVSGALTAERDRQLAAAAAWARARPDPVIVVGDLNVTPFSPAFSELAEAGGLLDSGEGFGWQPSWPAHLGPLGVPVDHLLHDRAFFATERVRGPSLGSDHRPLEVTLRWIQRR